MDGGWWTFDIWESEQSVQEFYGQRLSPILQALGLSEPKRRQLDVHWHSDQPQGELSKRGIAVQVPVVSRQIASARVATALALTSTGALAVGALAVGRLAIKALRVQDGRIERLSIQELEVGTLRVREPVTEQRPPRLWRR